MKDKIKIDFLNDLWNVDTDYNDLRLMVYDSQGEKICTVETTVNVRHTAELLAAAPSLVRRISALEGILKSMSLSMMAHPDCTENSEFMDMVERAKELLES